jgi:spore maturation protein B
MNPLMTSRAKASFSGSAAIAALSDIFTQYGPDSKVGFTASVLLGSSETIFYTLALYFGSVGVKKTRFTVPVALFALLTSVVTGLLFSSLFFGG